MAYKVQQVEKVLEDVVNETKNNEMASRATKKNKSVPKLVIASGHTEEVCKMLLSKIKENDKNVKSNRLGRKLCGHDTTEHSFRGFSVLGSDTIKIKQCSSNKQKRPIWFVFTGMGSQWPGMGRELMQIGPFKESIHRSAKVLSPVGVNLLDLIFNSTETTFDNVINRFIMIVSTQIALVDLLSSIGIRPDGIIGISTGELSCAYVDGSLTHEQAIMSAYWRGKCLLDSNSIPGTMAVVALSVEEMNKVCPSDIQLVRRIAPDYLSISGPKQSVEDFVAALKSKQIFAKNVDSAGIAFHSKYIKEAGARLKKEMEKLIPVPKRRSTKWVSTAVLEDCWENPIAKFSSPDYFVHNLLQPVYFLEAAKHISEDAITIEVSLDSRHWTLRILLKRYLPETTTHIALHKWNEPNHIAILLSCIGKLYIAGANPEIEKLCVEDVTG